jgi:flagellar biosynthetic protein FliR
MIDLASLRIEYWVSAFFIPLFRVGAFLMAMPMFGTRLVPMRVRLGLAIFMTLVIMPAMPSVPVLDGLSFATYLLIAQQILIGTALGFTLHLFFQVFSVGGQLIANQMGLGFASMTDPANGVSVVVLGQFYLMLTTLLFLAMDGHLIVFNVLLSSFEIVPPTVMDLHTVRLMDIALSGVWMFSGALLMSLPAVTALLVVNMSFGIMTKAAPQLNIFAIGFPLTMTMGLVITWLSLSGFLGYFERIADHALLVIQTLVEPSRG